MLELCPTVAALELLGDYLPNHLVLFLTDNLAVVDVINKQSANNVQLMCLVRRMVLAALRLNVSLQAKHIPGKLMSLLINCLASRRTTPGNGLHGS